jgi:hypothetical protein
MAGRRDDHVGMRRERLVHRVLALGRPHHDREVGLVLGELAQQVLAIVDGEVEDDAGWRPMNFASSRGKK